MQMTGRINAVFIFKLQSSRERFVGLDFYLTRWNVTVTILLKAGFLSEEKQSLFSCLDLWMGFLWLTAGLGLSVRNEIGLRVVPSFAV